MPEETKTSRETGAAIQEPTFQPPTRIPSAQPPQSEPSYYDVSFLKPPVWKWEIALYFFFGGLSAGSFLLSRVAGLFGGRRLRHLRRLATHTAFATSLPCAPLLIRDLGDKKRFHHMLRIFKPASPMSLGSWTLAGYSGFAALAEVRELAAQPQALPLRRESRAFLASPAWILADLAAIPLALLMAGYTGVLLSCTANPLWVKSRWLGPLFSSSALSTASSSLLLLMENNPRRHAGKAELKVINSVSHAAEAVCLAGYAAEKREHLQPLLTGQQKFAFWCAVGGLVASEVLKHLPLKGRAKTTAALAGSALGLAAGLSLRWAIVYAGQESANDPASARRSTQGNGQAPALLDGAAAS